MKKASKFEISNSFKNDQELLQYYNHKCLSIGSNECGMHDFSLRDYCGERTQDHYTLHFVLRGKGTFTLADKTFHCRENDVFITPSNVKVETTPDANDPWKYFWFGFDGNSCAELCESALFTTINPVYSCEQCANTIRELLQSLIEFIPAIRPSIRLKSLSALFGIFALITNERLQNISQPASIYSPEYYMQQCIAILESNYHNSNFKIESICEQLSVSHSYLCRVFKQLSGKTISAYLLQIRMREARVLLESNDFSIQSISEQCGFNDYTYFSKIFKKLYSMTPSQYRIIMRKTKNNF